MKKLLLILSITLLIAGCSKSGSNTPESKYGIKGTWELTTYTMFDPTGEYTDYDTWLIESISFNNGSVTMKNGSESYKGIFTTNDDKIVITIKDHPELTISGIMDLSSNNSVLKIKYMKIGELSRSWTFKQL